MRPRLSRDILVYGVGEVVVKAFGLITLPIYTRIFSAAEYGTLSVVLTVAGFILAVVALGGDSAFIRYFLATRDRGERRVITSTWIGFLAVWSVGAVLLMLPFAEEIAQLATGTGSAGVLILLALLLTPVRLINLMCAQVLRNEFRAWSYTGLNIAALGLMVAASLFGAIVLNLGIVGVLLGTLVAELGMLPVRLLTARHMLGWTFSGPMLRRLLAYGVPLVPTSLAYWVFTTSDRVMLSNLSTLEEVGLYSVAASLISLAMIAVTGLGQAWNPHAIYAYEDDPEAAGRLFARMFTYILAAFGLLAVAMAAFAPELIEIVAGRRFSGAAAAVAPLGVGMIAYASTQVTAGGISIMKRTGYLAAYSWMTAGINVGLNLLLIPSFGIVGAAWATAIAYIVLTVAYLLTSLRLWPFSYDWRRALVLVLLTAAALLLSAVFPEPDGAAGVPWAVLIGLKALLCVALVVAMFRFGGLDRSDLARVRSALARTRPGPNGTPVQ